MNPPPSPHKPARPLAAIFGIQGPHLGADEARFFRDADPLGFILFARNCETPEQVRALTAQLREAVGRASAPVLIDQEGGRVARLGPPGWPAFPPAARYGELYGRDPEAGVAAARLGGSLIGHELLQLGITVNCAPVLDVPQASADPIIGDRAFATTPEAIIELAGAFAQGLMAAGVTPVIKHIPGHGRAGADSHKTLPRVEADAGALAAVDFKPFQALAHLPWAMTAHVVYGALDGQAPATLSAVVVEDIIRRRIGFRGFLVSDDLSMNALSGTLAARTRAARAAGCDAVLHCNADRAEMGAVAGAAGPLRGAEWARFRLGLLNTEMARDRAPEKGFDEVAAQARFVALMPGGAA